MGKSSTIFQVQFRWLFNTNTSPNLNKHYLNLIFSIIFYQRHSMEWPLNISRCRVGRLRLLNVRLLNLFHKMLKTILLKLRTSFTFLVSTYFLLSLFTKMAIIYIYLDSTFNLICIYYEPLQSDGLVLAKHETLLLPECDWQNVGVGFSTR